MPSPWPRLLLVLSLLLTGRMGVAADNSHVLGNLERSFWLHASLGSSTQRGYPGYDDAAKNMPLPAGSHPTKEWGTKWRCGLLAEAKRLGRG